MNKRKETSVNDTPSYRDLLAFPIYFSPEEATTLAAKRQVYNLSFLYYYFCFVLLYFLFMCIYITRNSIKYILRRPSDLQLQCPMHTGFLFLLIQKLDILENLLN